MLADVDSVLTSWKNHYKSFTFDDDYYFHYENLSYVNGYRYVETTVDISTLWDRLNNDERHKLPDIYHI